MQTTKNNRLRVIKYVNNKKEEEYSKQNYIDEFLNGSEDKWEELRKEILNSKNKYKIEKHGDTTIALFNGYNDNDIREIIFMKNENYKTKVRTNEELNQYIKEYIEKYSVERDKIREVEDFIQNSCDGKICGIYGLRSTGKTIIMLQVIKKLLKNNKKVAYILLKESDNIKDLYEDLEKLNKLNYKYIFIDEITYLEGFCQCANILSDDYAKMGIHIVVAGTDSYVLKLASYRELYRRIKLVHTTFIGYKEYNKIYKEGILEYIRKGGTLNKDDFYDKEHTKTYIQTSIVDNIIHSLENANDNKRYNNLYNLIDEKLLNKAIEQAIQDTNKIITLKTISKAYKNEDYSRTIKNLKSEFNYSDYLSKEEITNLIKEKLEIFDKPTFKYEDEDIKQLKDFFIDMDITNKYKRLENKEYKDVVIFTQMGLRYNQTLALEDILKTQYKKFYQDIPLDKQKLYIERLLGAIEGDLIEQEVINNFLMLKEKRKDVEITQITENMGEWDVVVSNDKIMDIYEVKRSKECVDRQTEWLVNDEMCNYYENNIIGKKIRNRYVLYLGEDKNIKIKNYNNTEYLIQYKNVEKFLINLNDKNII